MHPSQELNLVSWIPNYSLDFSAHNEVIDSLRVYNKQTKFAAIHQQCCIWAVGVSDVLE